MRGKLLSEKVFHRIKELVLSNHFKPGERLFDRDLAKLLGVSRTPVREALVRLYQDGLLGDKDGKGYFVVDIDDPRRIADLYDLREVLEVHAVRLAVEHAPPQDLADLAEVVAKLDSYRSVLDKRGEELKEGLRVHEIIARASGNAFLCETLTRLLTRMRVFIWIETLNEDAAEAEETRREHAALLTHIRDKQVDEAESLMRAHIRRARDQILRIARLREAFYLPVDLSPIGRTSLRAGSGRAGSQSPHLVRHLPGGRRTGSRGRKA